MATAADKHDHTVPEIAVIFQCSPGTVTNWIKKGRLKAYRLGGTGHYRIPWAEVERLRADWTYSPAVEGF